MRFVLDDDGFMVDLNKTTLEEHNRKKREAKIYAHNEKFLKELYADLQYRGASYLYDHGKRNPEEMQILVSDLIDYKTGRSNLNFSYHQLYTIKDGLYYWKNITCGRYCFKRIDEQDENCTKSISRVKYEITKTDTSESDMQKLVDFLAKTEEGEFATCKKYLKENPHTLLKWYQTNTEQGGHSIYQWVAWTEMSLNEIDNS